MSSQDAAKVFHESIHRGDSSQQDTDVMLEYHEFIEAIIRISVLKYGGAGSKSVGVVDALNAFIHNNFRFGRGGTNLEAKESKIVLK